jgi:hypothetical protein
MGQLSRSLHPDLGLDLEVEFHNLMAPSRVLCRQCEDYQQNRSAKKSMDLHKCIACSHYSVPFRLNSSNCTCTSLSSRWLMSRFCSCRPRNLGAKCRSYWRGFGHGKDHDLRMSSQPTELSLRCSHSCRRRTWWGQAE